MKTWQTCAACFCLLLAAGAAIAQDVAQLAADLDHDQFERREAAERALVETGVKIVDELLAAAGLPEKATDAEVQRHFQKVSAELKARLDETLYRPLAGLKSLEARYRAERVRTAVARAAEVRLEQATSAFPKRLPKADAERVYGYTGGFRDGTTWFDTEFRNGSKYTVTSIHILVRLTHKRTGERVEREATLSAPGGLLRPDETAKLSVDVGFARSNDQEFYWETVGVFGNAPAATDGGSDGE